MTRLPMWKELDAGELSSTRFFLPISPTRMSPPGVLHRQTPNAFLMVKQLADFAECWLVWSDSGLRVLLTNNIKDDLQLRRAMALADQLIGRNFTS